MSTRYNRRHSLITAILVSRKSYLEEVVEYGWKWCKNWHSPVSRRPWKAPSSSAKWTQTTSRNSFAFSSRVRNRFSESIPSQKSYLVTDVNVFAIRANPHVPRMRLIHKVQIRRDLLQKDPGRCNNSLRVRRTSNTNKTCETESTTHFSQLQLLAATVTWLAEALRTWTTGLWSPSNAMYLFIASWKSNSASLSSVKWLIHALWLSVKSCPNKLKWETR